MNTNENAFQWCDHLSPHPTINAAGIRVRNSGEPDELCIFDVRDDETAHGAWITALEGGFVSLEEVR
ncbi:hypothetical protein ACFQGT_00210 [Natrialbaceae archaeon GCM10025810]